MLYLFDIDGTLIGGDGAGRRAFERACFDELGISDALGTLQLDGMTDPLILDHVFRTHRQRQASAEESARVLDGYVRHLERELVDCAYHIKPGVHEALDRLESRSAVVGLATGNVQAGARLKLERGQLWHRFPFGGFGSDASDRAELVQAGILRGLGRCPRQPRKDEIWVIGDTPRDVAAAHAAGAIAIGVATGRYSEAELATCGADAVFATLLDWARSL